MSKQKGFTLIEALVAMGILSFVIMSIVAGFSRQQQTSRNTTAKNTALYLAESKMEEMCKFPSTTLQLNVGTETEFIEQTNTLLKAPVTADPQKNKQFRRLTTTSAVGNFITIEVQVYYAYSTRTHSYHPDPVILRSLRWR